MRCSSVLDRLLASLTRSDKSLRECCRCFALSLLDRGIRFCIFTIPEKSSFAYCLPVFRVKSGNLLTIRIFCILNSLRIDSSTLTQLIIPS